MLARSPGGGLATAEQFGDLFFPLPLLRGWGAHSDLESPAGGRNSHVRAPPTQNVGAERKRTPVTRPVSPQPLPPWQWAIAGRKAALGGWGPWEGHQGEQGPQPELADA